MTSSISGKPAVPVLDKAMRVLVELAAHEGEATSSSLARRVGASQPTCYRILKTLEAADWICADQEKGYRLSAGLMPLVQPFLDLHSLGRAVQGVLDVLAAEQGLTAKLSVRSGHEQTTLAVAAPARAYSVTAPIGSRYPVAWGASGAALLSDLADEAIAEILDATRRWEHDSPRDVWRRIRAVRKTQVCENIGVHPRGIDTISTPLPASSYSLALTLVALRGDIESKRLPAVKKRLKAAARDAANRIKSSSPSHTMGSQL